MAQSQSSSASTSGLWKRQTSSAIEDPSGTTTPSESGSGSDHERSNSPLLRSNSVATSSNSAATATTTTDENMFIYGHMGLCLLFLAAGSSIVPLFAAAEDEAWRTQNVPYQKTSSGDVILDFRLNQPLVDPPTISSPLLAFSSIVVPALIVLAMNCVDFFSLRMAPINFPLGRSQLHELRAGVCGLLISTGLSEGVTQTLKLYVSRHRPCFYQLCGFDTQQLKCMAPLSKVHESMLSFPSGHSSLSFCGMTFLVWFFLGRLAVMMNGSGGRTSNNIQPYKPLLGVLCILVPWSYSTFVAASRIHDNWHHPSDVIAGTLIGIAAATIGYHVFYPPVIVAYGGCKAGLPLSLQQQQPQPQEQPNSSA